MGGGLVVMIVWAGRGGSPECLLGGIDRFIYQCLLSGAC